MKYLLCGQHCDDHCRVILGLHFKYMKNLQPKELVRLGITHEMTAVSTGQSRINN